MPRPHQQKLKPPRSRPPKLASPTRLATRATRRRPPTRSSVTPMHLRGIVSTVTISAVLLGGAVGCGVKGGDEVSSGDVATTAVSGTTNGSETTTTDGGDRSTTTDGSASTSTTDGGSDTSLTIPGDFDIRGAMVDGFKSAGFTDAQANCLADEYTKLGLGTPGGSTDMDPNAILSIFDTCHISMADLGKLGGAGG